MLTSGIGIGVGITIHVVGTLGVAALLPTLYAIGLRARGYSDADTWQLVSALPESIYPPVGIAIALTVPVVAGYVAARVARGAEYLAASVVAFFSAAFGLVVVPGVFGLHLSVGYPFGAFLLVAILSACFVMAGAKLGARVQDDAAA